MNIYYIVALMDGKDMLDTLYSASIFNLRKVKIYNWGQICVILQVSMFKRYCDTSYNPFVQQKSKSKSGKVTDLANLKEGQTINMMQMAAVVGANIE